MSASLTPYPDGESLEDEEGVQLLPGDEGEDPGRVEGAARHGSSEC